jgi:hypothetical protein
VPATLKLYLDGKIDQWWIRQTQTGAVFLMNVTSIEEARALMEELPLGKAALMKHEFIELGPLTPLHLLLTDGGATVLSPSGIFSPPFEAAVNPCRFFVPLLEFNCYQVAAGALSRSSIFTGNLRIRTPEA